MKWITTIWIFTAILHTVIVNDGCKKNNAFVPTPMPLQVPNGFPSPTGVFAENLPTKEGFELGRRLFYDGQLAQDGQTACASCHQQFAAFATFDHDLSHGVNNQFTTRNSPTLFNLAWQNIFHWDGGINHLEVQPLAPITAPNEMGETIENVINKLKQDARYRTMFKAAFGSDEINSQRMLKAIAQFVGSMVSANSKYDQMKRGAAVFTPAEQNGYQVFLAKCNSCHREPLFTDHSFRNIGLPMNGLKDLGRMAITGKREDSLKFKVPTLRNIMVSFPFMHDGRFVGFDQVFNHYSRGAVPSPTLDPLLRAGIPLNNNERNALLAFFQTLTDQEFMQNPLFSAPR